MQITVENVGLCRKRVQLVIPADRIREEVEQYMRQATTTLRIPGFRPGHIPRGVVEKRYGEAIRKDVKESLVNDGYQQALKEHNLQPLSTPEVDLAAIPLDEKNGMKVDFELDTRPEIEPKDYKGLAITTKTPSVADSDVAQQIEELKVLRRRPVKDESAAVEGDSFAIAAIEFLVGGESVLQRDSVRVRLGMSVNGADPKDFQKALAGKKVGDSFEIPVKLPDDFEAEAARGKEGTSKLTIREVYKLVPPSDEELLKDLDVADLDTLRADLRRRLLEARETEERRRVEEAIIDRALGANPIEIPDRIIDRQVEARLAEHEAHAEPNEATKAEELEAARKKLRPDMEKGLRRLFLLEAIARKEKIFVTEDDLETELKSIAERNQSTLDEVAKYYHQHNLLGPLRLDLLEGKVRNFLFEHAKRTTA